ncbi:MAG: hypothetical protein LUH14_08180 [Clostridiaceae bacterium]|nr:hypothetical protein [Clostridiaceae bacterium]
MKTQQKIRKWIPSARMVFKTYMHSGDRPTAYLAGPKVVLTKRAELVAKTHCPQVDPPDPYDLPMELLHGEGGDAILVNQQAVPDVNGAVMIFCHMFWHELAHYFAIYNECPGGNLYRFNSTDYPSTLSGQDQKDAVVKQAGYWFWYDFIAESIATYVDDMFSRDSKNGKHYDPEQIISEPDQWGYMTGLLQRFLDKAFDPAYRGIDKESLTTYFALLLMGDEMQHIVKAAENAELKVLDRKTKKLKRMKPGSIDVTCITELDKSYQKAMWKMKSLLETQLDKEKFWRIDEEFLFQVGLCILELREKI